MSQSLRRCRDAKCDGQVRDFKTQPNGSAGISENHEHELISNQVAHSINLSINFSSSVLVINDMLTSYICWYYDR
jgi:hypothetical protein